MAVHSRATRRHIVKDHSSAVKFTSLHIDMELTTTTTNSPSLRKLQKSLDPYEEFEFAMSHGNMAVKNDLFGPAMDISAPADKLFFKGHLLPLQADHKLKFAQSLACPPSEEGWGERSTASLPTRYGGELVSFKFTNNEKWTPTSHQKQGSDQQGFIIISDGEESCTAMAQQAGEGRHHADWMAYFQLDAVSGATLDLSKNDSRSSSFRSQHSSSFWTGDKDSRDSTSSSRCSNGSCQNSLLNAGVNTQGKIPVQLLSNCSVHPDVYNHKSYPCTQPNIPPHSTSNMQAKWSWKTLLFTGLKKASKFWDVGHDADKSNAGPVPTMGNTREVQKRPVFTFKELPSISRGSETVKAPFRQSVSHDQEWQANTYQFVTCAERSTKRMQGKHQSRMAQWLAARDICPTQEQQGSIYCLRSGGRREASLHGVQERQGEPPKAGSKANHATIWNAKESWSKCVNKVKKGSKLSSCKHKQLISEQSSGNVMSMMNEEDKMDLNYRTIKANSLSSTPLTKSPMRVSDGYISNLGAGYGGFYCMHKHGGAALSSSSLLQRNTKKVGFASCPASMRSSPHHSGLLAVVNKPTPDLHTAVQAAIDHCKQSQVGIAAHFDQLHMTT